MYVDVVMPPSVRCRDDAAVTFPGEMSLLEPHTELVGGKAAIDRPGVGRRNLELGCQSRSAKEGVCSSLTFSAVLDVLFR